jgi:DNA (cytosine-5)-methyltransferase 1
LVTVRKLLRLGRDCTELATKARRSSVAPNELILTNKYEEVAVSRIQRRCFVRFVSKSDVLDDRVLFPYNQGGVGDLWFFSMGLATIEGEQHLMFLRSPPRGFHDGPNIASDKKLKGLSIFSGGGSLDRGLEEGGAVEFHTAVDISPQAIHTQRANAKNPETMRLYCGSVDDFFDAALRGLNPKLITRIGEVDFLAGGTPCPGAYSSVT